MVSFVTFVGFLIHVYSIGYMAHDETDAGFARYFAYLNLFMFSMLVLVLGEQLPAACSSGGKASGSARYLLIGYYFDREDAATRGQEGVRRQPHRRLRLPPRDVRGLRASSAASISTTVFAAGGGRSRRASRPT